MTATSMIWRDAERLKQASRAEPTPAALCARIQDAAIKCEAYHVFVDWMPHVSALAVRVLPATTIYQEGSRQERLFEKTVYLDAEWSDPAHDLTNIIGQLQRMGVEV